MKDSAPKAKADEETMYMVAKEPTAVDGVKTEGGGDGAGGDRDAVVRQTRSRRESLFENPAFLLWQEIDTYPSLRLYTYDMY